MQRPLFVFHVDHPRPGLLLEWAEQHFGGYEVVFAHRQSLPDPFSLGGPVIVFGGPMGVRDLPQLPWLGKEASWIGELLQKDHPILGICLGAQLIAHALGQEVTSCPQREIECGYYPVASGGQLPSHVYHWHRDGVILTDGSGIESLGYSPWLGGRASQAFARGRMLGVQFHPEVSASTIEAWLSRDKADLALPGARPARTHLRDHALYGSAVKEWLWAQLEQRWQLAASAAFQSAAA